MMMRVLSGDTDSAIESNSPKFLNILVLPIPLTRLKKKSYSFIFRFLVILATYGHKS